MPINNSNGDLSPDDSEESGIALGCVIRRRRRAAGKTLEQLAQETGIPKSSLSRVEKGECRIDFGALRKIGRSLKVPTELLVIEAEADLRGNSPEFEECHQIVLQLMRKMKIISE